MADEKDEEWLLVARKCEACEDNPQSKDRLYSSCGIILSMETIAPIASLNDTNIK